MASYKTIRRRRQRRHALQRDGRPLVNMAVRIERVRLAWAKAAAAGLLGSREAADPNPLPEPLEATT